MPRPLEALGGLIAALTPYLIKFGDSLPCDPFLSASSSSAAFSCPDIERSSFWRRWICTLPNEGSGHRRVRAARRGYNCRQVCGSKIALSVTGSWTPLISLQEIPPYVAYGSQYATPTRTSTAGLNIRGHAITTPCPPADSEHSVS